jgi:DNA-binding transcriptional LysR family regulator
MVELRQLEYFVAVADERSFSRAAEKLHVVQSTVSAAIQALERELSTQLIIRSARQFILTPAGSELQSHGRELLRAERTAVEAVLASTGVVSGQLRLGAPASAIPLDVPALLGRYQQRFPNVDIRFVTSPAGSSGLQQSVLDGTLDAAFSSLGAGHPDLVTTEVAAAPVDLIVPGSHHLAGRAQVSLAEVATERFIDFPLGFGQRAVTDRAFHAAHLTRHIAIEISSATTAADFVRHGLGVALLPRSAVVIRDDLSRVIIDPAPQWQIYFTHHAQRWRPPALSALLEMLHLD